MKGLFLVFHGFGATNAGISKKIISQKKALESCGLDVNLCYMTIDQNGYHKRMIDDRVLENYGSGVTAKIKKRISYSVLFKYILNNNINLLYIRSFHNTNPVLLHFLKKIRRSNIKTIMEIPTYPYDQEYQNVPVSDRIRFCMDKLFRKRMSRYISHIVTFSNEKYIFGIPTINISNGVDFDLIKLKTKVNANPTLLHLIGVAEIHFWHGFDRVLEGMAVYYKEHHSIIVTFDIIGDGVPDEIAKLKAITSVNQLGSYVRFHGSKSGKELDQLFEEADMGIASLGRHRSNIKFIKPLKNREYAARGIPFVYSEIDDDFEEMPYIMKAPASDSPLNIEDVVKFFYSNKFEPFEIRKTIEEKLSWKVQMKKVIDTVFVSEV